MKLHNMFKKTVGKEHGTSKNTKVRNVPEGLLKKCNKCGAAILAEDAVNNNYICPKCHGYFRMHAGRRIEMIADPGTFEEWDAKMKFENPLEFSGYEEKVRRLREQTGLDEAVVTGKVMVAGHPAVIGVCDGRFMMASMGEVVGEKITRAIERATKENLPVILFACSGGARMQEGIVSLMQMAKTAAALKRHSEKGLLYVSVLTDPTTGGVTGKLCHAWRYYSGRAECADRVCRTEGDRADDRKEAAERISEVGVFARTWICRSDRRAVGNEKRSCAYFAYA